MITAIFLVCQFFIMKHTFIPKEIGISPSKRISSFRLIEVEQYVLGAIIVIVVLQILIYSSYDRLELVVAVTLSYGTAVLLMGLLAYRLFRWFSINKSIVTLLFGILLVSLQSTLRLHSFYSMRYCLLNNHLLLLLGQILSGNYPMKNLIICSRSINFNLFRWLVTF